MAEGEKPLLAQAQAGAGAAALRGDGQAVYYTGGWSDPGLEELWLSGYGSLEYNLLLAGRPQLPAGTRAGAEAELELAVQLHLLPGFRLFLNGQPLDSSRLPMMLDGELSLVDAQGQAILLQPPLAYEQAAPAVRAGGRYAFAPAPTRTSTNWECACPGVGWRTKTAASPWCSTRCSR